MATRKRKQIAFVPDHSTLDLPYVYDLGDDNFSLSEGEEANDDVSSDNQFIDTSATNSDSELGSVVLCSI